MLQGVESLFSEGLAQQMQIDTRLSRPGVKFFDRLKGAWATGEVVTLSGFLERLLGTIQEIVASESTPELPADTPRRAAIAPTNSGTLGHGTHTASNTTPVNELPLQPNLASRVHKASTTKGALRVDIPPRSGGILLTPLTETDSTCDEDSSTETTSPTSLSSSDNLPPSTILESKQDLGRYMTIMARHALQKGKQFETISKYPITQSLWRFEGSFDGVRGEGIASTIKTAKHLAVKQICEQLDILMD